MCISHYVCISGTLEYGVCDNMLSDIPFGVRLCHFRYAKLRPRLLEIMTQIEEQKSAQRLFVRAAATNDQQAEACLAGRHTWTDLPKATRSISFVPGTACKAHRHGVLHVFGHECHIALQAALSAQTWRTTYPLTLCPLQAADALSSVDKAVSRALREVCIMLCLVTTHRSRTEVERCRLSSCYLRL